MKLTAHAAIDENSTSGSALANICGGGVSVIERLDNCCVLLTSAVDGEKITKLLSQALALNIPTVSGTVTSEGNLTVSWLSPRSWLAHLPENEEDDVIEAVERAFPDRRVNASRFSDHICWFELTGGRVEALLKQGGFISLERHGLPVDAEKRTLIAGIPLVIRRCAKVFWLVGVERSRARYFANWLNQAHEAISGDAKRRS